MKESDKHFSDDSNYFEAFFKKISFKNKFEDIKDKRSDGISLQIIRFIINKENKIIQCSDFSISKANIKYCNMICSLLKCNYQILRLFEITLICKRNISNENFYNALETLIIHKYYDSKIETSYFNNHYMRTNLGMKKKHN